MRFKKGSNVEVLRKKEVPSGSWWCAKIICRDGHKYTVRYGVEVANDETVVERVHRTAIRPCPPPVEVTESWVPGDIVEVFDNFSWKMATISEVLGNKYFLVRIVGSCREYKVGKLEVRVRQFWQDDKWVVVGKGSSQYDNGKQGAILSLKAQKVSFKKSHTASSQNLKRGSSHLQDESYGGATEKFRAVEREGRCQRVIASNLSRLAEHVDVALPSRMLGGKEICASLNNRTTVLSEVDLVKRKPSGNAGCLFSVNLKSDDVDTVTCSVGSCSIGSNDPYKSPHHVSSGSTGDFKDQFCDAESVCHLGYEEGNSVLPTKKELAAEIHRLELQAYRCTIEALHASGPLSWEQEELVTNLRLSLHISNDEHLMELRNLISADNNIHIR
ncbi:PREDICTED: uncharacterized protein LOC101310150 [Fragaria vesca subsp. vesca]|uniref:uncharacterized protein LOC101310150 n=1 Tax=Fragaria vesca subsp. vesca TaxID=101020 RepID=UPI0002C321B8|nr:PREDICTED: uncharacterized protein LOC101310150 [Fragaria vesca subsp. vesca]XP_011458376.1 PREDICTED: uncharacterized protein LOC101310150 [Fragaria vesca subsp. vesca]XP_011458380.1 PREDICTED: uncharacterized protein LOC101310150 [Fragaria vesca subsp. vesca]